MSGTSATKLRSILRCGLLVVAAGLAACSYTFDGAAPGIPLVGEEIPPTAFPKLNPDGVPINDVYVMPGADGVSWAVLVTAPVLAIPPPPILGKLPALAWLVRLDGNEVRDAVRADQILVGNRQLYLLDTPLQEGAPMKLRLRRPGDDGVGRELMMPTGGAVIQASPKDEAFVYIASREDTRTMRLLRSDGSFERELPLPEGVEAARLFEKFKLFFNHNGELLITQEPDGKLIAHDTRSEHDKLLGVSDPDLVWGGSREAIISCGAQGLRRFPLDGSGPLLLDGSPCQADLLRTVDERVLYRRDDALYAVPERGGSPLKLRDAPIGQILAVGPNLSILYSRDPALRYGAGIGDGYLGDALQFERGRRPAWSTDGTRLRWLGEAARSDGGGEFTSKLLQGGEPILLAHNVRQFLEVAPGRVLAISNAAGRGLYNRLILVDEQAGEARWVVSSARAFTPIPDTNEVLVSVVNGQIGYDVRRVSIPQ